MASGLIVKGLLSAAFLAATYFLRPSSSVTRGGNPNIPIQQSDFGVVIPIVLGSARVGGNIVWTSGLRREDSVENVGGKGGPSSTVTSYAYFVDLAVMLARTRVIDVLRIWADGKLIFDKTGASDTTEVEGLTFRLLPGDEDQQPDALIQTEVDGRLGAGSTPAYRGRSVIIFEDLALENFGNRIPNLSFEVVTEQETAAASVPEVLVVEGALVSGQPTTQDAAFPDWDRGIMWIGGSEAIGGGEAQSTAFSLASLDRLRTLQVRSANLGVVDPITGDIMSKIVASSNVGVVDDLTGAIQVQNNAGTGAFEAGTAACSNALNAGTKTVYLGVSRTSVLPRPVFYQVVAGDLVQYALSSAFATTKLSARPTSSKTGTSYGATIDSTVNEMDIFGLGLASSQPGFAGLTSFEIDMDASDTFNFGILFSKTPASFGGSSFTDNTITVTLDEETNDILVSFELDSIIRMSRMTSLGSVLWTTTIPFFPPATANHFRVIGRTIAWLDDSQHIIMIDIVTGKINPSFDGVTTIPAIPTGSSSGIVSGSIWDEKTFCFYMTADNVTEDLTKLRHIKLGGGQAQGISLADVVSIISSEAGLEIIEDYDVSELVPTEVPGYVITEQQSARNALQPLSDIFNFDGIESDYKLKFRLRGRASTAVVIEDDMIRQSSEVVFGRTRVQEAELPRAVQVITFDPDNAYQQGLGQAERVLFPGPTILSDNQRTVESPIVLDSDRTRQAAEKTLYTAWNERNGFEFRTHWGFVTQDPSDVITMTFNDGFSTLARLEEANTGADLTLDMRGVGQGAGQYSSDIGGQSGSSIQVNIPLVQNAQLFLMDMPLLRDIDSPATGISRMYWAGNTFNAFTWAGGILFESENLTSFLTVDATTVATPYGALIATLSPPQSPWVWDTVNTIELTGLSGSDQFVSSTDALVLNGANALALIRPGAAREVEIVQFVNAVQNADASITLSRLLRGRRGTEVFSDTNHLTGTLAVLLTVGFTSSFLDASSEAGQPHVYKLVTASQSPSDAIEVSYTPTERSLKPYAPTQQTATTNVLDIDLAAVRRTRVGGELIDGTGTVPLSEESEEYELEILDGPGGAVLRTVLALTTPFYKYLEADIVTDFGTPPATIDVVWYQISAALGRGFPGEANVEVQ